MISILEVDMKQCECLTRKFFKEAFCYMFTGSCDVYLSQA